MTLPPRAPFHAMAHRFPCFRDHYRLVESFHPAQNLQGTCVSLVSKRSGTVSLRLMNHHGPIRSEKDSSRQMKQDRRNKHDSPGSKDRRNRKHLWRSLRLKRMTSGKGVCSTTYALFTSAADPRSRQRSTQANCVYSSPVVLAEDLRNILPNTRELM